MEETAMKRFILNSKPDRNGIIRLEGEDYHYLVRVRRLACGEFFPAFLPSGDKIIIRIISVERGVLSGECIPEKAGHATDQHFQPNMPSVILFQALPKGEKMDIIVRQAAETGLAEIVPFQGEFSVSRIRGRMPDKGNAKLSRWRRIVKEARQQSGSPLATLVQPPMTINELFAYWDELKTKYSGVLGILFHQVPLANESLHSYLDKSPELVVLTIGPEGGFSTAEASRFMEAGFKPLTIGDAVLRTETAALYAAAAIRIILLERDSWEIKQKP
jgi:16S rRNA (uracil1498-N3)-methyltransferase